MDFEFTVKVHVERSEGLFASRDELSEQIIQELEGADPGQLEGDNGGQYDVESWDVEEVPRKGRR